MNWTFSVLLALANIAILPTLGFLLVVTAAAYLPRRKTLHTAAPSSRFLIVIPAHNEELMISTVVRSCLAVDYPRPLFDVLVVADNSSDQTAKLARGTGARVVERFDESKKSKGHAIDYLIKSLEESGEIENINALVIVDADSTVDRGLLSAFDQDLRAGCDWIQAYYQVANPDASWRTRLLTYAMSLFNGVVPLGKTRLGLGGSFQGNGMCLSVRGLRRVPWECHGLVEDLEYTWKLRMAGERVVFQPDVSVYGVMRTAGDEATANQRRRWEFGRKEIRRKYFAPLLTSRRLTLGHRIFALCDLTLPTMTTLVALCVSLAATDIFCLLSPLQLAMPALRPALIFALGLMTLSLGIHFVSPFLVMRLPWRYVLSIGAFPVYIWWKICIWFGARPDRWIRTARETVHDGAIRLADEAP
jgi:cellulose synthase/poly-beta-1,6-N-acetylglucosamine synthase-like glycosyltransferase